MKKKYYVDLCSFEVEAESSDEAVRIAVDKMNKGEFTPEIHSVERVELDEDEMKERRKHGRIKVK